MTTIDSISDTLAAELQELRTELETDYENLTARWLAFTGPLARATGLSNDQALRACGDPELIAAGFDILTCCDGAKEVLASGDPGLLAAAAAAGRLTPEADHIVRHDEPLPPTPTRGNWERQVVGYLPGMSRAAARFLSTLIPPPWNVEWITASLANAWVTVPA